MYLPALISLAEVRDRLELIFPEGFPDRSILVGDIATRTVFVGLYGGFIADAGRFFRPSTVIRFSLEQAARCSDFDRMVWLGTCHTPGHKSFGQQWYADNTRETLRDDYIRNRAVPMGFIEKLEGVAPSSPAPIYSLAEHFADLFSPDLFGPALDAAIANWREEFLDPIALKRMRLVSSGIFGRDGDVFVTLPNTGQTLRLPAGDTSIITKDVIEILAEKKLVRPVVVHLSMSDIKMRPELASNAESVGLAIDPKAELPDIVIADVPPKSNQLYLYFVEVVHSDGPITELRKKALLHIAEKAGIPERNVVMITAFNDRSAAPFKKRFSELAAGSCVWFRTEPHLFIRIGDLNAPVAA